MKAGVVHCRCSRCYSFPLKRRVRKRPQVVTLLSLPEDVLLHILKGLPAEDILSLRAVHSHLKYLVDNHTSVWACASFEDVWPSPKNLKVFERAAERGNFEAAVKLGIAYLYNEGLSIYGEGHAEVNGLKASYFFSLAEHLNVSAAPFIWLFIRPPWSLHGSCCKAVVYESLKAECHVDKAQKGSILYCLAKVSSLFEMLDPGRYLQSLRKLRDYATKGCWEAQLTLAKACGSGNQLGLEAKYSNEMVAQMFQASCPISKQSIFAVQKGINETMRYILVDWLVEVATMKDFPCLCLHLTVACVDHYLKLRPVPRYQLQLLGIACMVICTRFISNDILTIREAVWLTDNTYKYEELVRMMGEIISVLKGKIRIPTIVDYKEVLSNIVSLERRTLHLYSFICDLSLLNTSLFVYSPARLAAAALLLAKILHGHAHPWTRQLSECTGFSLEDLLPCVLSLHKKWRREDSTQDDRGSIVTTQAVELSTQEESLLDSFLDWSLDSGSGYEGDQESEGEKDGDVTSPSGILNVTVVYVDPSEHCCQDSSDDDTQQKECSGHAAPPRKSKIPSETHRDPACIASRNPNQERSSGYSSVNGTISTSSTEGSCGAPPKPTSAPCLGHAVNKKPCLPHYLDSRLQSAWARASDSKSNRRQVKRKNLAEHSEERMNLGFLSL
ncbi:hypothetical protein ASZ78_007795 [Callipepla squamata]|uniref:Cyclin-F n=1 Tax=Callipepla squamata TaxID=9009 RepID=A0A226MVH8_CALSU|nr:hypothetical protein ASZ78_007795 [Callipepla squamata]